MAMSKKAKGKAGAKGKTNKPSPLMEKEWHPKNKRMAKSKGKGKKSC